MSRYPYTNACDLIRMVIPYGEHGCKLSRSDASQIRSLFSTVLGIDDEELAKKLADYFLKKEEEISEERMKDLKRQLSNQLLQ